MKKIKMNQENMQRCKLICVFNIIDLSAILCQSVLLVEENREKTTDLSQVTDKLLLHIVVHPALIEIRTHNISGDRY